ncbi:hypothetical protein PG991_007835 [Apiospora marii]|uniref:Uncharacterized protein n=1 Tax=Apiospora marii TaxID=335849 RepID=A0ABR1RUJ4_9PEZI
MSADVCLLYQPPPGIEHTLASYMCSYEASMVRAPRGNGRGRLLILVILSILSILIALVVLAVLVILAVLVVLVVLAVLVVRGLDVVQPLLDHRHLLGILGVQHLEVAQIVDTRGRLGGWSVGQARALLIGLSIGIVAFLGGGEQDEVLVVDTRRFDAGGSSTNGGRTRL